MPEIVYEFGADGVVEARRIMTEMEREQDRADARLREREAAEVAAYAEDRRMAAERIKLIQAVSKAEEEAHKMNHERSLLANTEPDNLPKSLGTLDKHKASIGGVADAIKMVGKDLDNLGLQSGKTFAMATEGALSVAAALGTGGMAGVVGLATVAVGALVQGVVEFGNANKVAAAEAQKNFDAFKQTVEGISALIAAMQKPLTTDELLAREAQILARRAAAEQRTWDIILAQDELARLKRASAWSGPASELYEKAIKDQERRIQTIRDEIAEQNRQTNLMRRQQQEDEEQLAFQKQATEDQKAAEKLREQKKDAAKKVLTDQKAADARLAKEFQDAANRRAQWETEMGLKGAARRNELLREEEAERVRIISEGIEAEYKLQQAQKNADEAFDSKAASDAIEAEWQRMQAVKATTAALEEKRKADAAALLATTYASAANLAFGASAMVTGPVIAEYTSLLRSLGEVNQDNYRSFVLFSDELPAIIAKKTQAILAGIAAEATGKALQSTGDGIREMALGTAMATNPLTAAQAPGHFIAAGTFFAAASAYGAISGVAIGGTVAIGAARGGSGPIPLTREEMEQNNRGMGGGGGGGDGGFSGGRISDSRMRDDGPFNIYITNMPASINTQNPRTAARAISTAIRSSDVFAERQRR